MDESAQAKLAEKHDQAIPHRTGYARSCDVDLGQLWVGTLARRTQITHRSDLNLVEMAYETSPGFTSGSELSRFGGLFSLTLYCTDCTLTLTSDVRLGKTRRVHGRT